jgi:hypothetical protein
MSLTPIDRFAGAVFIAFFVFALIFARNQDYTRSGSENIERVSNSQTLNDVRFGMEERLAANALHNIGAVTVLPKFTKEGNLDVRSDHGKEVPKWDDCIGKYLQDDAAYRFYRQATYSIVAIEMFNRPAGMRWLKDHIAWMTAWLGWQPSFSLGVGQVKIATLTPLTAKLKLPQQEGRAKYLTEVSLLTDTCANVAVVAALLEQAYGDQHQDRVSAKKRDAFELGQILEEVALKYHGTTRKAVVFDYGVMVRRAYDLIDRARAASVAAASEAAIGSADLPADAAPERKLSVGMPSLQGGGAPKAPPAASRSQ